MFQALSIASGTGTYVYNDSYKDKGSFTYPHTTEMVVLFKLSIWLHK